MSFLLSNYYENRPRTYFNKVSNILFHKYDLYKEWLLWLIIKACKFLYYLFFQSFLGVYKAFIGKLRYCWSSGYNLINVIVWMTISKPYLVDWRIIENPPLWLNGRHVTSTMSRFQLLEAASGLWASMHYRGLYTLCSTILQLQVI